MSDSFHDEANEPGGGLLAELRWWLADSGKWWLAPVVLAIVFVGWLAWLSSSWAAPFIYPLF